MKTAALIYLVTRAHGLRTHLISSHDIQFLAGAKSLRELSDNLLKTEYGAEISKLPTTEIDAAVLEEIFLRKLVERYFFVAREAQGKIQDLLYRYCARFEVENIKRIIRAKHGRQTLEEPSLIPLPREYTLVNFPALLNAKDVDEVVALLHETFYRPLLQRLQSYKEVGATIVLEAALDETYLRKVWEAIGNLSDRGLKDLIGEEIDLRNLLIAFSLKARDAPSSLVDRTLIPVFYRIPKERLRSIMQVRLEDAQGILTPHYSKLVSEAINLIKSRSSKPFERPFLQQLYQAASNALKTQFFDAGYILAYLLLCECEARNLTAITIGKQLGLQEEEISQSLFML